MAPEKLWSEKDKMESEGPIMQMQQQQNSPDDRYDVDYEKHGASRESNPLPDLKRKLKSRHLQMIAIGESQTFGPSTAAKVFSHAHGRKRWYHWNRLVYR